MPQWSEKIRATGSLPASELGDWMFAHKPKLMKHAHRFLAGRLLSLSLAVFAVNFTFVIQSSAADSTPNDVTASLRGALTFHASFDGKADADFAAGDARIEGSQSRSCATAGSQALPDTRRATEATRSRWRLGLGTMRIPNWCAVWHAACLYSPTCTWNR